MGLREELGGKLEEMLNKLVDEHLSADVVAPLVLALIQDQLEKVKHKLKADVIDLLDGVDDLK